MTAISPLGSIHKKGVYGDHHKKNQSNLLEICEVKNLKIIQIFQYKKSKVEINEIKIDNLLPPTQNSNVSSNKETRILWNAPKTWLVVSSKEGIVDDILQKCSDKNFAVTDLSHSRTVIQIRGLEAIEVLKKGCPINLNEFKLNNCAGTIFHGINIIVDFVSTDPNTFNLFTLRSFGETFYHHVTDAALEYGFIAI